MWTAAETTSGWIRSQAAMTTGHGSLWPVLGLLTVLSFVLALIPIGHRYGMRGVVIVSTISATAALITAAAQFLHAA